MSSKTYFFTLFMLFFPVFGVYNVGFRPFVEFAWIYTFLVDILLTEHFLMAYFLTIFMIQFVIPWQQTVCAKKNRTFGVITLNYRCAMSLRAAG